MTPPFGSLIPQERISGGPAGWFVTFGDLLTLLLAFFVVTVSHHARHPQGIESKSESDQSVAGDLDTTIQMSAQSSEPGTSLAESDEGSAASRPMRDESGRPYAELVLVESELSELRHSSRPIEYRFAGQGVSAAQEFEVRVCGGADEPIGWGRAERDAQLIVRQLSDVSMSVPVRVQILGPHCDGIARVPYREVRAQLRMYG